LVKTVWVRLCEYPHPRHQSGKGLPTFRKS